MFNNHKKLKKLEGKISELEEKILDEYDIRNIVGRAIEVKKAELNRIYEVRMRAREEAWDAVTSSMEGIVEQRLPDLIEEASKDIQDRLIVELARKAMNMEDK